MTHKKIYHRHPYSGIRAIILLLLMLLQLHTITMLTVVVNSSSESEDAKSESLSTISSSWSGRSSRSSRSSTNGGRSSWNESDGEGDFLSKEIAAPLLTFTLRTGNNNGSLEQSNPEDNNAGIHKAKVKTDESERRGDELHFYSNEDNEGDNNDSNVSSESNSDTGYGDGDGDGDGYVEGLGRRIRRDAVLEAGGGIPSSPPPEGEREASKAISTNWGTYEEQAPVVVHSGSRSVDESDATAVDGVGVDVGRMETDPHSNAYVFANTNANANDDDDDDDDSYAYGDEYQSKENENENESGEYDGESFISYDDEDDDDYEGGHFEGRQFYSSQGVVRGDVNDDHRHEEKLEPSGYYRQQYYATARPLSQQGKEPSQQPQQQQRPTGYRRPGYRNRLGQQRPNNYHRPPHQQQPHEDNNSQEEEQEPTGSSLMGFFQKAKTFYDIFQAMNSAWKTVEQHYRKTSGVKGVFPQDHKYLNQSTQTAPNTANQSVNNKTNKMSTKRLRTTRVPIIPTSKEDQQQGEHEEHEEQQKQQDMWQEKDEYRSRRSWLKETVNDSSKESVDNIEEDGSDFSSKITESDLGTDSSSASTSTSTSQSKSSTSSSTAIAEGRYIKGDPLKGYYDFVITEGSYKFWAVFQVGTALLIIYSTFAAIYYSKVNPLVSDYDYVDYLGGGRSLSDDSDFVDMDAPIATGTLGTGGSTAAADGSETKQPEGVSRSRQQQQQQQWIGWLPHAGHTLRFILESIDKVYNEE